MSKGVFEGMPALPPSDCFQLEVDAVLGKKCVLPDTSELLGEDSFATFTITCTLEGLQIKAEVKKAFEECFYPDYEKGDSLELFIDTRDIKTSGFMTRFCHHFVCLPTEVQGVTRLEVTRFRTEDVHPLCDPLDLELKSTFSSNRYVLDFMIPSNCLHGYDPISFNRLGFTYRLNRPHGSAQHFSVSSDVYSITQHPSLWATIYMRTP